MSKLETGLKIQLQTANYETLGGENIFITLRQEMFFFKRSYWKWKITGKNGINFTTLK